MHRLLRLERLMDLFRCLLGFDSQSSTPPYSTFFQISDTSKETLPTDLPSQLSLPALLIIDPPSELSQGHTGDLWVQEAEEFKRAKMVVWINLTKSPHEHLESLRESIGRETEVWSISKEGVLISLTDSSSTSSLKLRFIPRSLWYSQLSPTLLIDNAQPNKSVEEEVARELSENLVGENGELAVCSGYLYLQGLEYLLSLLDSSRLRRAHLLFSGKVDQSSAEVLSHALDLFSGNEALTSQPHSTRIHQAAERVSRYVEEDRIKVRVYPHGFLHAKLFLAWDDIGQGGLIRPFGFMGSSNLTRPGVSSFLDGGNLELNLKVSNASELLALHNWFWLRWGEAIDISPEVLQVQLRGAIKKVEPFLRPPPELHFPELQAMIEAGYSGKLEPSRVYLARLKQLLGMKETADLPTFSAFPIDESRPITPAPEQIDGVESLVRRLLQRRIAYLADSVGLGKTITALGAAWFLQRSGLSARPLLIAPQKLQHQWEQDADQLRLPSDFRPKFANRHKLEHMSLDESKAYLEALAPDLVLVEEAHESLRSRTNKLWRALHAYLSKRENAHVKVLFISATPWNNRREDIFNVVYLSWSSPHIWGPSSPYPYIEEGLSFSPRGTFIVPANKGAKIFKDMEMSRYQELFGAIFVQRTRYRVREKYQKEIDFPQRVLSPHILEPNPTYDRFFIALEKGLAELSLPYREVWFSVVKSLETQGLPVEVLGGAQTNLQGSFINQLYKRAESSIFALAVSLRGVLVRLDLFKKEVEELLAQTSRDEAVGVLIDWLARRYLKVKRPTETNEALLSGNSDDEEGDEEGAFLSYGEALFMIENLNSWEKGRLNRLTALKGMVSQTQVTEIFLSILNVSIPKDKEVLERLLMLVSHEVDVEDPKALKISEILKSYREPTRKGGPLKVIVVSSFADTALRYFIRAIDQSPRSRIGLALGGGEAWLYDPEMSQSSPLSFNEWTLCTQVLSPSQEEALGTKEISPNSHMLSGRGRRLEILKERSVKEVERKDLIQAFAPKAQHLSPQKLASFGGEVDILIGSEAISVGHNLQDATVLIHADNPWNPMVLEQRIGRIDRRGGGRVMSGREEKVVDVHYIWNHEALEGQLNLKKTLEEKAKGAILDTYFDELLLQEILAEVNHARNKVGGAQELELSASLSETLERHQRSHIEESIGLTMMGGMASNTEGRYLLQGWSTEPLPEMKSSILCCGIEALSKPRLWLVTLHIIPLNDMGDKIGEGFLENLVFHDDDSRIYGKSDFEILVKTLIDAHERNAVPHSHNDMDWREAVMRLDEEIFQKKHMLLSQHQDLLLKESQERQQETLDHRIACHRLRDSLLHEIEKPYYAQPEGIAVLSKCERELELLLDHLDAQPELIGSSHVEPAKLKEALSSAARFPSSFLQVRWEEIISILLPSDMETLTSSEMPEGEGVKQGTLCLSAGSAQQEAWADLEIKVVAVSSAPI